MDAGVGATLRDARNRRKIDLSEVEAATKIRARYLRAIENEEWELLPGEAYARGFVRTYAAYLGLDAERLVEQHRRGTGASRPSERLPRVDPAPVASRKPRRAPRLPPRLLAVLVSVALVAILVVVGLSSGGSQPGPTGARQQHTGHGAGGSGKKSKKPASGPKQLSLRLTATADVWVCLLDAKGSRLVDGQILAAGSEVGPFRSGSFTFSLGNGEVTMIVDGEQESIPATSSPVGYTIGRSGKLRPLSEGERPTCT